MNTDKATRKKNVLPRLMQYKDTKYYASDAGDVYRLRKEGYVRLSPSRSENGYLRIVISHLGLKTHKTVHSVVANCFLGSCPVGKQINHKDGNKTNNVPSNLEYCTNGENIRHAVRLGLKKGHNGEQNSASKLTEKEVNKIRELYSRGLRVRDIVPLFPKTRRSNIGLIVNNQTWTHLKH